MAVLLALLIFPAGLSFAQAAGSDIAAQAPASEAPAAPGESPSAEAAPDSAEAPPEEAPKQKPKPNARARLIQEGERIATDIEELIAKGRLLQEDLVAAEGEDRLVIERTLIDLKVEILESVGQQVKNFKSQENLGIQTPELHKRILQRLRELEPAIGEHIDEGEAELSELRLKRDTLPPEEQLAADQQIARHLDWLQTLYTAMLDQSDRMKAMGMNADVLDAAIEGGILKRADSNAGRLELLTEQMRELKARAGDPPVKPEDQAELAALEVRTQTTRHALNQLLRLLERLDLDTSRYRQLMISSGSVTSDIFKPAVAMGLLDEGIEDLRSWLRENTVNVLFQAVVFILIVAFFRLLALMLRRLLERAFDVSNVNASRLLRSMMVSMLSNAVTLLGVLVALSQLGIQMGPLLAGLGIAGFIVGFALQDSLSNFAAGMMILGYRPYDVGDLIETSGVRGEVSAMSLVSTTILTIDNQTLIVPNGRIWGDVIKNITNQEKRRVDMTFRVSYGDDVEHAERVFKAILEEHPKVLDAPPLNIRINKLNENSIEFIVRPWVETADYWDVYWDVTREVVVRFGREGLAIPYPRQVVQLDSGSQNDAE